MARVFISHSSHDRDIVESEIVSLLHDHEIHTWYSADDVETAEEWHNSIRAGLESCDWFLVALSPDSIESRWVKAEVAWAMDERPRRIVPLLLSDCDPSACHLQLKLIQHIDWRERERAPAQLLRVFDAKAGPTVAPKSASAGLIAALAAAGENRDAGQLPLGFRSLRHEDPSVQSHALDFVERLGWDAVAAAVERMGREDDGHARDFLDGLSALEPRAEVVTTLQRLSNVLTGELRYEAIGFAERKQLGLQMAAVSALFERHQSPLEMQRVLGQGAYTASYLAFHRETQLPVVVRVLRPELAIQGVVRTRFLDAMRSSMRFRHQNLAMTLDVRQFESDGIYFTVRDYIDGTSLQRIFSRGEPFPQVEAIRILIEVSSALVPVHAEGAFYGGVNPSNIFLTDAGRVVLADAAPPVASIGGAFDQIHYHLRYAAPESFATNAQVGPRADVYSLGCVAYQLLAGHPPYESDDAFELAGLHRSQESPPLSASEPVQALVHDLLRSDPERRPASAGDVVSRLGTLDEPTIAPMPAPIRERRFEVESDRTVLQFRRTGSQTADSSRAESGTPAPGAAPPAPSPTQRASDPTRIQRIGPYEVVRFVAEGGMAWVFEVVDPKMFNRHVALKMLKPEASAGLQFQRFETESRLLASIEHPNLVSIFDFGRDDATGCHYYTMTLIEGKPLSEIDALPIAEAAPLFQQVLSGLAALHERGVVHRDVKPANILARPGWAWLGDLGIAREDRAESSVTQEAIPMGTPLYMSPEQIAGQAVAPSSDVFSAGLSFYRVLTGHSAYESEVDTSSPTSVMFHVAGKVKGGGRIIPRDIYDVAPRLVGNVIVKACSSAPADRYPDAAAMLTALQLALGSDEAHRGSRRRVIGSVAGALAFGALAFGTLLALDRGEVGESLAAVRESADLTSRLVDDSEGLLPADLTAAARTRLTAAAEHIQGARDRFESGETKTAAALIGLARDSIAASCRTLLTGIDERPDAATDPTPCRSLEHQLSALKR